MIEKVLGMPILRQGFLYVVRWVKFGSVTESQNLREKNLPCLDRKTATLKFNYIEFEIFQINSWNCLNLREER